MVVYLRDQVVTGKVTCRNGDISSESTLEAQRVLKILGN